MDGSTALFDYTDWSQGTQPGDCIGFSYTTQPISGTDKWTIVKTIDNKPCDMMRSFICEHEGLLAHSDLLKYIFSVNMKIEFLALIILL